MKWSSLCRPFYRVSSFNIAAAVTAANRLRLLSCMRSCALALVCLTALSLHAQSADSAGLEVDVRDPSGALVADASLILINHATGVTREGKSDKQGRYRFTDVPVGDYTLTIKREGFDDLVESGITLTVGQSATLPVNLKIFNNQQVEVIDTTPLLDTSRTTNGQTISTMEIENLPSNGRNFADFALTVPGVTPQATSGQGSGLSVNGQRGRSNSVLIDGVENNGDLNGTIRQTLPLDAVSQFQVMTSQFLPEYGNAGGGIINLVTKTGTPDYHGDIFYFVRNAALNAHPFCISATNCPVPIYNQNDLGGSLGGPVPFDKKTVFFGAVEYIGLNTNTTDILSPTVAADINTILALRPLVGGGVTSISTGNSIPQSNTQTVASLRLDRSFTQKDNVTLRLLYAQYNHNNPTLDRGDGDYSDPSNYGYDHLQAYNATLIYNHVFTPNLLNEMHLLAAPQHLVQVPNTPNGPTLYFATGLEIGRNLDFPTILNENHFEGTDSLSWSKGKHLFKVGTDIDAIRANTSFPTDFGGVFNFSCVFSTNPGLLGPNYPVAPAGSTTCADSFESGTPYQYIQGFGTPKIFLPDWLLAGYIQDSWKVLPRVTLNYGLRYDLDLQPQGYNGDLTNPIQAPLPKGIPRDYNNFGPRVALAWSVDKAGKTVVRAGYGIFYDKIFLLVARNTLLARGTVNENTVAAATAQFLTGPFPQSTSYPTGASVPTPTINAIAGSLPIPYAGQASLYIDHQLAKNWVLELAYINVDGVKQLKSANVNLAPPVILTASNATALCNCTPTFQQLGRPYFGTAGTTSYLNPSYTAIQQVGSYGHSRYNAFQGSIIHNATRDLVLRTSWIWSKEIDDASDFTQAQQADNPYNPHAERGLGNEDQRNRWTGAAVWKFPYFIKPGSHNSTLRWIGGNWTGSLIGSIYSGSPENIVVGSDVNDDGNASPDRPYITGLNGVSGGSIVRRNAYRGPRQQNVSLRLQKRIPFTGRYSLQFSAEAFNAFNHVNYSGVDTIWGTGATPGSGFGSFTSAGSMRAIQLGVRFFY